MKRKTLKLKMSLWFTIVLTFICIIIIAAMLSIYRTTDRRFILQTLTDTVDDTASHIRTSKRSLSELVDGDRTSRLFLETDVQLMVYDEDGGHAAGMFLFEELDELPFSGSDTPEKIRLRGKNYYYYDKTVRIPHSTDYCVRGIIAAQDDFPGSLASHKTVLIILPFLLVLAFAGGYIMTGKFLMPVKTIRQTAEEIRSSGDLTKRIATSGNGDEIDELAHTINAMFDKLENDFDAQKQFTSNASHELRTPVSVILAQCENGFDNADDPEELLRTVSAVQKQGYKMAELIRLLLMFTRIEQGTEHYPKANTDLTELVHSVCEDMRIIDGKNITITESLEKVSAYVNREMFTLMTVNLLQNALRYGKEGGNVRVSLSENGDEVILSVDDDGIGISAEDMPHIWERFYRSDRSRSSNGTGLGLALVRQIAEYHGGKADAVSAEGVGSCFTVTIMRK